MSKLSSLLFFVGSIAILTAGVVAAASTFGLSLLPTIGLFGASTATTLAVAGAGALVGSISADLGGAIYERYTKDTDDDRREQQLEMQRENNELAHKQRMEEIKLQHELEHQSKISHVSKLQQEKENKNDRQVGN